MSVIQIVLLIAGAVLFVISFIVPDIGGESKRKEEEYDDAVKLKDMAQEVLDEVGKQLSEMVDETVGYANERTERSMERVSNEKIMAISEYSETVMADMEKAHKEILFLYDMLNDKTAALNNTIREADAIRQSLNQVNDEGLFPQLDTITETESEIEDSMEKLVRETEEMVVADSAKKRGRKKKESSPDANLSDNKVSPVPDIYGGTAKNKNEKVLALHKEGKSNVAIAKELGLGVGEVKLVIDLFKGAK